MITNRAKINSSGFITVGVVTANHFGNNDIAYTLADHLNQNVYGNIFVIAHSDCELFWSKLDVFQQQLKAKLSAKDIAKTLWETFIGQVGVDCLEHCFC